MKVKGREHLKGTGPLVLVANHASYLDVPVLSSVLAANFVFVAKQELLKAWVIGPILRRGRHLTVDRLDPARTGAPAEFARTLAKGTSVLLFPEGIMTPVTGLRPFTLGAFTMAAESGRPVCPIAIHGTRRLLRDGESLPRPGRVEITIGVPITPREAGWKEAIRLRDLAQAEIARHCGEPVLDLTEVGYRGAA